VQKTPRPKGESRDTSHFTNYARDARRDLKSYPESISKRTLHKRFQARLASNSNSPKRVPEHITKGPDRVCRSRKPEQSLQHRSGPLPNRLGSLFAHAN
jgi:hypothetical protein